MSNNTSTTGAVRLKNELLILEAAKKEFVVNGFKGASIKSIAQRAQIPRANIHYYFKDKADIYRQLLDGILNTWNSHYDTLTREQSPKEALSSYIRSKILYSKEEPEASRIFASELIHGAPMLTDYFSNEFKHWMKEKVSVIEYWIDNGLMNKMNPQHLLFIIWSSTQHYADFNVQVLAALDKTELSDTDYEDAITTLTQVILNGCGIH